MVSALIRLGIRPTDIVAVDVPYSAHSATVQGLLHLGIPSENLCLHRFSLAMDYKCASRASPITSTGFTRDLSPPCSAYQKDRVCGAVRSLLTARPRMPHIVLDDGCYFLEVPLHART